MIDGTGATVERDVEADRVRDVEQEDSMTMTTTASEPSTEHDRAPSTPAPSAAKRVLPARKLTDEQELEVTQLYAETATPLGEIGQRFGISQTSAARIAQRRGAALRSPNISRAAAAGRRSAAVSVDAGSAVESEPQSTQAEPMAQLPAERGIHRAKPARVRRTASAVHRARVGAPVASTASIPSASRQARTTSVVTTSAPRRFVVTFVAEQVLEAKSALDAWEQAQTRGATDVMSIVRVA